MRILKSSLIVPKSRKGNLPLGFSNLQFAAKYQENWETKNFWKKKSHSAEKNSKVEPYILFRFCILR